MVDAPIVKETFLRNLTVTWLLDGSVGPANLTKGVRFVQAGVVVGYGPDEVTEVTIDGSRGMSMAEVIQLINSTQEPTGPAPIQG